MAKGGLATPSAGCTPFRRGDSSKGFCNERSDEAIYVAEATTCTSNGNSGVHGWCFALSCCSYPSTLLPVA